MMDSRQVAERLLGEVIGEILVEPPPSRVPEGTYDAVVLWVRKRTAFRREVVVFRFRLVGLHPYKDLELPAYANLNIQKHGRLSHRSKLTRWWRLIVEASGGRRDRIVLNRFRDFLYQVRVRTVVRGHDDGGLEEGERYEVVAEILNIVGPIKRDGEA